MERVSDGASERLDPDLSFVAIGRIDGRPIADCGLRSGPSGVAGQLVGRQTESRGAHRITSSLSRGPASRSDSRTRPLRYVLVSRRFRHTNHQARCGQVFPWRSSIACTSHRNAHYGRRCPSPGKSERLPVRARTASDAEPHIESATESLRDRRRCQDNRTRYRPWSGTTSDSSIRPAVPSNTEDASNRISPSRMAPPRKTTERYLWWRQHDSPEERSLAWTLRWIALLEPCALQSFALCKGR
jgi:hypothetical protein